MSNLKKMKIKAKHKKKVKVNKRGRKNNKVKNMISVVGMNLSMKRVKRIFRIKELQICRISKKMLFLNIKDIKNNSNQLVNNKISQISKNKRSLNQNSNQMMKEIIHQARIKNLNKENNKCTKVQAKNINKTNKRNLKKNRLSMNNPKKTTLKINKMKKIQNQNQMRKKNPNRVKKK